VVEKKMNDIKIDIEEGEENKIGAKKVFLVIILLVSVISY
jgi:hypothetical protein